jgi:hypothetical protein
MMSLAWTPPVWKVGLPADFTGAFATWLPPRHLKSLDGLGRAPGLVSAA